MVCHLFDAKQLSEKTMLANCALYPLKQISDMFIEENWYCLWNGSHFVLMQIC